jgi:hypothetical protein
MAASHDLTEAERREYVLDAFRQFGKDYDFSFDVEPTATAVRRDPGVDARGRRGRAYGMRSREGMNGFRS